MFQLILDNSRSKRDKKMIICTLSAKDLNRINEKQITERAFRIVIIHE